MIPPDVEDGREPSRKCYSSNWCIISVNTFFAYPFYILPIGMLAEMDRDATVARLAGGKKVWRGQKRVDGPLARW